MIHDDQTDEDRDSELDQLSKAQVLKLGFPVAIMPLQRGSSPTSSEDGEDEHAEDVFAPSTDEEEEHGEETEAKQG